MEYSMVDFTIIVNRREVGYNFSEEIYENS